jgi:3-oxoacyl-[acyl-carrier protein] reductase
VTAPLHGVSAIVTGSTRGLGLAFANALAANHANVVINGRTDQACLEAMGVIAAKKGQIAYVAGNVAEEAVAEALVDRCLDSFGRVDIVVNNAGITRDKSLIKMTAAEFDDVISVHLRGTWLMCRSAARAMKSTGGSILNVTSGSALYGLVGQSNYAAAKGGIIALTRALSVELERYRIGVNALYPVALTDMTAPLLELSGGPGAGTSRSIFGEPADVAKLVVALAAPNATDLTGQILAFDGTELAVWTHPEQSYQIRHDAPWGAVDMAAGIAEVLRRPAVLHPDAVGLEVRAAPRRARQ